MKYTSAIPANDTLTKCVIPYKRCHVAMSGQFYFWLGD